MIADTKRKLAHLVEINTVLASELDECRRKITELSRERDSFKERVVELELDVPDRFVTGVRNDNSRENERLRRQIDTEQNKTEEIRRERDLALRHADEERERADLSEQRLHTLTMKLREVVRERNIIMAQLDESTAAMDEIRYHLTASVGNQDSTCEADFEC